jgi:exosortase
MTAVALLACYASVLRGLADQWSTDEDMSHGFLIPLAIAWIVWRERSRWLGLRPSPDPRGIALLALGAAIHLTSAVGAGLFVGSVAFVVSLAGAVLALGGPAYLRAWAWPLTLTLFMLPKLAVVYNQLTLPLQLSATRLAAAALRLAQVHVIMQGNILEVANYRVAVEEACNGVRFLLPLAFLAALLAYYYDPKPWMRAALAIAAVPLAVLANALRVGSAVLLGSIYPALGEGLFHAISGALIFALCVPILVLFRHLINRVYDRYAGA